MLRHEYDVVLCEKDLLLFIRTSSESQRGATSRDSGVLNRREAGVTRAVATQANGQGRCAGKDAC